LCAIKNKYTYKPNPRAPALPHFVTCWYYYYGRRN